MGSGADGCCQLHFALLLLAKIQKVDRVRSSRWKKEGPTRPVTCLTAAKTVHSRLCTAHKAYAAGCRQTKQSPPHGTASHYSHYQQKTCCTTSQLSLSPLLSSILISKLHTAAAESHVPVPIDHPEVTASLTHCPTSIYLGQNTRTNPLEGMLHS